MFWQPQGIKTWGLELLKIPALLPRLYLRPHTKYELIHTCYDYKKYYNSLFPQANSSLWFSTAIRPPLILRVYLSGHRAVHQTQVKIDPWRSDQIMNFKPGVRSHRELLPLGIKVAHNKSDLVQYKSDLVQFMKILALEREMGRERPGRIQRDSR